MLIYRRRHKIDMKLGQPFLWRHIENTEQYRKASGGTEKDSVEEPTESITEITEE